MKALSIALLALGTVSGVFAQSDKETIDVSSKKSYSGSLVTYGEEYYRQKAWAKSLCHELGYGTLHDWEIDGAFFESVTCSGHKSRYFTSYQAHQNTELDVNSDNFKDKFNRRNQTGVLNNKSVYQCIIRGITGWSKTVETHGTLKFRAMITKDAIMPSCTELVKEKVCTSKKKNECRRYEEQLVSKNVCQLGINSRLYQDILGDYIPFSKKDSLYVTERTADQWKITTRFIAEEDNFHGEVSVVSESLTNLPDSVVKGHKVIGHVNCYKQGDR